MDDRYATEELTEAECWALVSEAVVGRLAVCLDGRAHIFPVNFISDRGTLVFRTAEGTKLSAARDRHVAFEIDGYDADEGVTWSVVIAGEAREIVSGVELSDAFELPLFPWQVGPKAHFVRVAADEISGRRFRAPYAGTSGFRRDGSR